MKMFRVFLSLGSNLGERQQYLNKATAELKTLQDTKVIWASPVYETEPYGNKEQPRFLNAAIEIETVLDPEALHSRLKDIETNVGRSSHEHWGPREIDIDILLYDGMVFQNERLSVPHKELEKRRFVLVPLQDIGEDVVHPINGMTVAEMVAACKDASRVVKTQHRILL